MGGVRGRHLGSTISGRRSWGRWCASACPQCASVPTSSGALLCFLCAFPEPLAGLRQVSGKQVELWCPGSEVALHGEALGSSHQLGRAEREVCGLRAGRRMQCCQDVLSSADQTMMWVRCAITAYGRSSVHEVHIDEEQMAFLDTTLTAAAGRPVAMFTHAPPLGSGLKVLQVR